jgi:hypothetical protein
MRGCSSIRTPEWSAVDGDMDPALLEPSIVVTDGRRGSRRSECSLDCAHERKLYNACHAGQPPAPAPAGLTAADQARRCNVRATANGSARWRWGGAFSVVRVGSIGKEHFAGVQRQEGAAPHTGDTVSACWRRAAQVGVNRPACSVVAGIHIARLSRRPVTVLRL